jgi:hypothetical protein
MFKFVSLKKFKLAQHKWQKDEEALLLEIITYPFLHSANSALTTGNSSLKNSMNRPPANASFALPNSAGNTGAATWTRGSRRDRGSGRKTGNCCK